MLVKNLARKRSVQRIITRHHGREMLEGVVTRDRWQTFEGTFEGISTPPGMSPRRQAIKSAVAGRRHVLLLRTPLEGIFPAVSFVSEMVVIVIAVMSNGGGRTLYRTLGGFRSRVKGGRRYRSREESLWIQFHEDVIWRRNEGSSVVFVVVVPDFVVVDGPSRGSRGTPRVQFHGNFWRWSAFPHHQCITRYLLL